MEIIRLELGPYGVNTYLIVSGGKSDSPNVGRETLVIDPVDSPLLTKSIENLDVKYIVNTHGHFDHIGGNNAVKEYKKSKIIIHKEDAGMLTDSAKNLSVYIAGPVTSEPGDIVIDDENFKISLNGISFQIIFVPGHTMGSIALYNKEEKVLFSGDFIFKDTIGRTDFPGSSFDKMRNSILKIIAYPDDTAVYPGHEESFLLGDFKKIYKRFISDEI